MSTPAARDPIAPAGRGRGGSAGGGRRGAGGGRARRPARRTVRRTVQSVVYLPHFISWVIIVAIFQEVLGGAGVVNQVLRDHALPTVDIMANPALFKPLVTAQVVWQGTGWGTIIYLAALTNI